MGYAAAPRVAFIVYGIQTFFTAIIIIIIMKATTIPVVIGVLGLIKKGLEKYTKQIPGNIKISELQKIALLGTSRILRKTLSIK